MSHLLAITVGPVQEFIAAARRTRDLWFGSYLLSEISKAAAKAVQDNGGKLIFPAPAQSSDLQQDSPLNVANVILAELNAADPQLAASRAKTAAISAAKLRAKVGRTLDVIIDEVDAEGGANARSKADAPDIDGTVFLRDAGHLKPGDIVPVMIEEADDHDLFGVPASR